MIEGAPLPVEKSSPDGCTPLTLLPLDDERFLTPQHPIAPPLSEADKLRLAQLGLSPDQPLFRVGRFCGNNNKPCSNCDSTDHGEELVFRPESLTPQ